MSADKEGEPWSVQKRSPLMQTAMVLLLALVLAFGVVPLLPSPLSNFLWLVGASLVTIFFRQNSLLYIPTNANITRSPKNNPRGFRHPSEWGMPWEEIEIQASDGVHLRVWFITQPETRASAPTIIYFHGNAGNIGMRLEDYARMFSKLEVNILCAEYRGYGDCGGSPSEAGLCLDAFAILCYVMSRRDIHTGRVCLFGRSLGGAVSVQLAHRWEWYRQQEQENKRPPLMGLILENTFTSVQDLAPSIFSPLRALPSFLLQTMLCNHWPSEASLIQMAAAGTFGKEQGLPLLLLSGLADRLIPPTHMRKLLLAARGTDIESLVRLESFPEGGHNDTPVRGGAAYYTAMAQFLFDAAENQAQEGREVVYKPFILQQMAPYSEGEGGGEFEGHGTGKVLYDGVYGQKTSTGKGIGGNGGKMVNG